MTGDAAALLPALVRSPGLMLIFVNGTALDFCGARQPPITSHELRQHGG